MFEQLMGRIAGRFARVEPRRRATALVLGLLSGLPRKNCWTLAEHAGDATPDGMQHLLHRAKWDADVVRDDVRAYVVEHLHDDEAVLVVDETGDLKKGTTTVGVQRQYTGTAGRIENSQVAVYLVYSATSGHAAIDRALYVPRSWTDDPDRCRAAGIPNDVGFATKPQLATRMVIRALDAGTPALWVAGDEAYVCASWSCAASPTRWPRSPHCSHSRSESPASWWPTSLRSATSASTTTRPSTRDAPRPPSWNASATAFCGCDSRAARLATRLPSGDVQQVQ
jgi:hypothetical protein